MGVARPMAIIAMGPDVIIDSDRRWARRAITPRPVPDPGARRTDGHALVPARFSAIDAIFKPVERTPVETFIAAAFAPIAHIFDKIRAARRLETPSARLGRRCACAACNGDKSGGDAC